MYANCIPLKMIIREKRTSRSLDPQPGGSLVCYEAKPEDFFTNTIGDGPVDIRGVLAGRDPGPHLHLLMDLDNGGQRNVLTWVEWRNVVEKEEDSNNRKQYFSNKDQAGNQNVSRLILRPGDICICKQGEHTGKLFIWGMETRQKNQNVILSNDYFVILRFDPEDSEEGFGPTTATQVYFFLRYSLWGRHHLSQCIRKKRPEKPGSKLNRKNTTLDVGRLLHIPIPIEYFSIHAHPILHILDGILDGIDSLKNLHFHTRMELAYGVGPHFENELEQARATIADIKRASRTIRRGIPGLAEKDDNTESFVQEQNEEEFSWWLTFGRRSFRIGLARDFSSPGKKLTADEREGYEEAIAHFQTVRKDYEKKHAVKVRSGKKRRFDVEPDWQ